MAYVLTVALNTDLDSSRTATSHETREEAIAAGQQALADTLAEESDVNEEYEEQGNDLAEDNAELASTGCFEFEGMGCNLQIRVVDVQDYKVDAFIAGFEA